ncbi:UNVERIFIED_CONTAM: hypothetical protein HDU68_006346 [Siphonaria sp. JEL0065]|nr:hypothetical protein HDU68_006346 [Siphonaria sp. JEL0065]
MPSLTRAAALFRTQGDSSVLEYVTDLEKPVAGPGTFFVFLSSLLESKKVAVAGQLLVKNHFIGVNFVDTYQRAGLYKVSLPYIPGGEASGVVEAVGEGVDSFKIGDRVAYLAPNAGSEYALANPDKAVKLPDSVSFEQGASLLTQGLTAAFLVRFIYEVKPGDTVLIHAAAGGTGQILVQLAKHYGATVIGTTSTAEKAKTVLKAGADHVILYKEQDVKAEVLKITNGKGVQVVYDGVGKSTFDISLSVLARLGTLASFGNASGKVENFDALKLVPNSVKVLRPSLGQFLQNKQEWDDLAVPLIELYTAGKIKLNIHKIYDLKDIKSAHDDIESGTTQGKLLLRV